jgi:hypothetical protein
MTLNLSSAFFLAKAVLPCLLVRETEVFAAAILNQSG